MGAMALTPKAFNAALEIRRQIADELRGVEAGDEPRTGFDVQEIRLMLDQAIAG